MDANIKKDELLAALRKQREELRPPYKFPDNNGLVFPTMDDTTINEAIQVVWEMAFRAAADVVEGYFNDKEKEQEQEK